MDGAGNVTVSIALAHAPQLHVKAIDQYRLPVWTQWGAGPLTPIDNVDGTPLLDGRWPVISSGQITSKLSTPESDAKRVPPQTEDRLCGEPSRAVTSTSTSSGRKVFAWRLTNGLL